MDPFKDPDLDYADVRSQPGWERIPEEVLASYELAAGSVELLDTHSYDVQFRVDADRGTFDEATVPSARTTCCL